MTFQILIVREEHSTCFTLTLSLDLFKVDIEQVSIGLVILNLMPSLCSLREDLDVTELTCLYMFIGLRSFKLLGIWRCQSCRSIATMLLYFVLFIQHTIVELSLARLAKNVLYCGRMDILSFLWLDVFILLAARLLGQSRSFVFHVCGEIVEVRMVLALVIFKQIFPHFAQTKSALDEHILVSRLFNGVLHCLGRNDLSKLLFKAFVAITDIVICQVDLAFSQ